MIRRALLAALAAVLIAPAGVSAGTAYVRLNESGPHWGDTITFTAYQTAGTNVGILLVCGKVLYKGVASGEQLYMGVVAPADASGHTAATPGVEEVYPPFMLPLYGATGYCTAYLRNQAKVPMRELARTTFTVEP